MKSLYMRWLFPMSVMMIAASQSLAQIALESLTPVDQAIADLDPLTTSQRYREHGLSLLGQGSSLFQIPTDLMGQGAGPGATNRQYYRIGRGYVARVSRIDYVIPVGRRSVMLNQQPVQDGQFIELIPPDTVFELTPIVGYAQQTQFPEPDSIDTFWEDLPPLPSIYDTPVHLGTWQQPLWRKTRPFQRSSDPTDEARFPGDDASPAESPKPISQRDPLLESLQRQRTLSHVLGQPLNTRVTQQPNQQSNQHAIQQPSTPANFRALLQHRDEIRRERQAQEAAENESKEDAASTPPPLPSEK